MDNLKICVIMATYFRKNGKTKEFLSNALRNLESQTYKDFTLFLIGDHYDDNNEFEELCKSYKKDIFYKNNEKHYRNCKLNDFNRWAVGGGIAIKTGIEIAIENNFDYYFHLDDDDTWEINHIELVVDHIKKFPLADFILTKSKYCNIYLPKTSETNIFYNNYIPNGGDSVHSSHIYKLNSLGSVILNILNNNDETVNTYLINPKKQKFNIMPGDAKILDTIRDYKMKVIYIPYVSVTKLTDYNIPL